MAMNWEQLLCEKTLIERKKGPSSWDIYPLSNYEKDYREIVISEEFRRLQDKTQVFPLVKTSAIHTRLTHSLEVSSIGRQLGMMIAHNRREDSTGTDFGDKTDKYGADFSSILACAGLLHDLGNPPYGHFGEASLGWWFKHELKKDTFSYAGRPVREVLSEQMQSDLCNFEGNAQALRMLLKTERDPGRSSMNITYATMNTIVKYPVSSLEADGKSKDIRKHKYGFFLADKEGFEKIRAEVGLSGCSRYPLAYLLEASDDIAYMVSDLKDSVCMKVVSIPQVLDFFKNKVENLPEPKNEDEDMQQMIATAIYNELNNSIHAGDDEATVFRAFDEWLEYLKNWSIYATSYAFFNNYDAIMDGTYEGELLSDGWYSFTIDIIKSIMKKYVYVHESTVSLELIGHKVLNSLLDKFVYAVINWDETNPACKQSKVEQRYMCMIPEKYRTDYLLSKTDDSAYNLYLRFLMVIDFVSGLTDVSAMDLYKLLEGI